MTEHSLGILVLGIVTIAIVLVIALIIILIIALSYMKNLNAAKETKDSKINKKPMILPEVSLFLLKVVILITDLFK